MAAFLVPPFHQIVWRSNGNIVQPYPPSAAILILVFAGLIAAAVASENPILVYPLGLLSVISLLTLLTLAYTMIWVLLLKRENSFTGWKQLQPVLLLAIITTLVQIGLIDAGRFLLTGTWAGFTL